MRPHFEGRGPLMDRRDPHLPGPQAGLRNGVGARDRAVPGEPDAAAVILLVIVIRAGGSFGDGKGEPGQSNSVSHGCPPARFRNVNIVNTGRSA